MNTEELLTEIKQFILSAAVLTRNNIPLGPEMLDLLADVVREYEEGGEHR